MTDSTAHATAALVVVAALALALGACGGDGAGMPRAVMPRAEVVELQSEAAEYARDHIAVWPDVDAFLVHLAEDTTFADPTLGDLRGGRDYIADMWRQWADLTDYTIDLGAVYLAADGAVFEERWPGLGPPLPMPPGTEPRVASGLSVYAFRDGMVAGYDIWYLAEDNEAFGVGCFAEEGCPALRATVDRYVAAWSSRDPNAVAALYSSDAVFSDSMLGLAAEGAANIGDLAALRFGSAANITLDVVDVYAWTNGPNPPVGFDLGRGALVGVAIHYRATTGDGTEVQESVATLELCARHPTFLDPDPQGLIHSEKVYHEPAGLLEALDS